MARSAGVATRHTFNASSRLSRWKPQTIPSVCAHLINDGNSDGERCPASIAVAIFGCAAIPRFRLTVMRQTEKLISLFIADRLFDPHAQAYNPFNSQRYTLIAEDAAEFGGSESARHYYFNSV